MSTDPPFPSVAIVGLGLIGGSIALGVRERWPESRVFGVDSEAVLAHALGAARSSAASTSIGALPEPIADHPGGAGPPEHRAPDAARPRPSHRPLVVTDVGGTKRDIVSAARALPPGITFVGGHPLGGGERGGFAFARPDLFAGRPWIFTPDRRRRRQTRSSVSRRFVTGLGARPVHVMPPRSTTA